MPVKIIELEAENIKRVKAVQIVPALNGLTIIGGDNNQGKTSVLDAIAWALGGDKYRPEAARRRQHAAPSACQSLQWAGRRAAREKQCADGVRPVRP